MTIEEVNDRFDWQIKQEIKSRWKVERCPSFWGKKLFNLTVDLTPDDWKAIRTEDYWKEKRLADTEINSMKISIEFVENYLNYVKIIKDKP